MRPGVNRSLESGARPGEPIPGAGRTGSRRRPERSRAATASISWRMGAIIPAVFLALGLSMGAREAKAVAAGGQEADPMAALARSQDFTAARASSTARDGGNLDTVDIPADGSEVTIAEIPGPGAITHIWNTFRGNGRDLVVRIYWEGSGHPSVEAPIGDLFGVAMGVNADVRSYPVQDTSGGRARNCWWRMPFNKSARVTVSNAGPEKRLIKLYYYIDYARYAKPVGDINYFHARFIETDPTVRGKPVLLAEASGEGHFVGVVMGVRKRTPGWFGEGDDIITVDGKRAFVGTGTEDYFCDAWGFRVFSSLFHGVPVYEGRRVGDRLSAYRFHVLDPIPFRKSFKFEIEHWPWVSPLPNSGREYYSSTAFWYQADIHEAWPRLTEIVSNGPWDPAKGRWHAPGALEAEDLGVLGWKSTAVEPPDGSAPRIEPDTDSRDVLKGLLRFGPQPRPVFLMPNFSGDHILGFDPGGAGGEFTLAVPAAAGWRRTVKVAYVRGEDFGTVQLYVNGKAAGGPVDTFLKTDGLSRPIWPPNEFVFEGVELRPGMNEFRFVVTGRNGDSAGCRMAIDYLKLGSGQDK